MGSDTSVGNRNRLHAAVGTATDQYTTSLQGWYVGTAYSRSRGRQEIRPLPWSIDCGSLPVWPVLAGNYQYRHTVTEGTFVFTLSG